MKILYLLGGGTASQCEPSIVPLYDKVMDYHGKSLKVATRLQILAICVEMQRWHVLPPQRI